MSELSSKTCVPCRGGVPPLEGADLQKLSKQVPEWKVIDGHHISRTFTFADFRQALDFVNKVGELLRRKAIIPIFSSPGARR